MEGEIKLAAIELISKALWPLLIFGILLWQRRNVSALFTRMRRAGPTGIEFAPEEQTSAGSLSRQPNAGELKQLKGLERTEAIGQIERNLHISYGELEEEDRLDIAIREIAQTKLDLHFALAYHSIFGSQIKFLKVLRDRLGSMDEERSREYFSDVKNNFDVFSEWSYEKYFYFLENNGLTLHKSGNVEITPYGNDFILFMFRFNLSDDRPF